MCPSELSLLIMVIKLLSSMMSQIRSLVVNSQKLKKCLALSVARREQILLHGEVGMSEPVGLKVWLCPHVYCTAPATAKM